MKKAFHSSTIETVLGMGTPVYEHGPGVHAQRTPLHVEYGSGPDFSPAVPLEELGDAETFNAVGSKALDDCRDANGAEIHLPVIDADGGALIQERKLGSKAILYATRAGVYGPGSMLRDVLGDNGIYLEVFQHTASQYSNFLARTELKGNRVSGIVLRTEEPDVFVSVPSTQEGHGHLYIQRQFTGDDHKVLIDELGELGVISARWQRLTTESGMGIVRTPWTEKAITHKRT